jgi:outer membrane protein OmpA-like peptidoglycan-associated protein
MKKYTSQTRLLRNSTAVLIALAMVFSGVSAVSARVLVYMGSNFHNGLALSSLSTAYSDNEVTGISAEGISGSGGHMMYFSTIDCQDISDMDETTVINPHTKYEILKMEALTNGGTCELEFERIAGSDPWGWFDATTTTPAQIRAGIDAGTLAPNQSDLNFFDNSSNDTPNIYVVTNTKVIFKSSSSHPDVAYEIRMSSPTSTEIDNPAGEQGATKDFVFDYEANSNAGPNAANNPPQTLHATSCTGLENVAGDSAQAIYEAKALTPTTTGQHTFRTVLAHDSTPSGIKWNEGASVGKTVGWSDGLAFGGKGALLIYSSFDPNNLGQNVVACSMENSAAGARSKTKTTMATSFINQPAQQIPYIISDTYPQVTSTLTAGTTYTLVYIPLTYTGKYVSQARFQAVKDLNDRNSETVRVEVWQPPAATTPTAATPAAVAATCNSSAGVITFKADSAQLTKATKNKLNTYAQSIKDSGCKAITLSGHAATTTKFSKSFKKDRVAISKARNAEVAKYLEARFKKIGATVTINKQTLGGKNPVASNKSEKSRAKNRRVEILLANQ